MTRAQVNKVLREDLGWDLDWNLRGDGWARRYARALKFPEDGETQDRSRMRSARACRIKTPVIRDGVFYVIPGTEFRPDNTLRAMLKEIQRC